MVDPVSAIFAFIGIVLVIALAGLAIAGIAKGFEDDDS